MQNSNLERWHRENERPEAALEAELLLEQPEVDARRLAELAVELHAIIDDGSTADDREVVESPPPADPAPARAPSRRVVLVSEDPVFADQLAVAFGRIDVELTQLLDLGLHEGSR